MIDSNRTLCCTINNEFSDLEEIIIQYPSCALFLTGGGGGGGGEERVVNITDFFFLVGAIQSIKDHSRVPLTRTPKGYKE